MVMGSLAPKLHQAARWKQGFSCPENTLEPVKAGSVRVIINLSIAESLIWRRIF
jgi:hypothetical protein